MIFLQEWEAFRQRLWDARSSGVREVKDQNGESISYRSDTELANAIQAVEGEIRRYGQFPPNTIIFFTSKGV